MYIKSKPGRYGLLLRVLSDAQYRYFCNMRLYRGKDLTVPECEKGCENIVKTLAQPYFMSGRSVTTDRYYTSVNLAKDLFAVGLTLTGTVNANRKNLPLAAKSTQGREKYSNEFFFHHFDSSVITLVSHIPKKNMDNALLLLSSGHVTNKVPDFDNKGRDNKIRKKSEINLFYNSTKGGVDTLDYMCRVYTAKRGSSRWTMSLFGTLIDMAAINTQTCCYHLDLTRGSKIIPSTVTRSISFSFCNEIDCSLHVQPQFRWSSTKCGSSNEHDYS